MSLGEATAMGLALALGEDKAVRNHFAAAWRAGQSRLPPRPSFPLTAHRTSHRD